MLDHDADPGQAPAAGARICLHADVDKMYLAVEAAERPDLAAETRPVVVGYDPDVAPRGIVTTANGVARALGIGSGLSTAIARQIARRHGLEVVFIPPRHDLYAAYSRQLMAVLREASPIVEQRSIDEAALDWTRQGWEPAPVAALRQRIQDGLGLSVSFGMASNPLVAKMASEMAKSRADHVTVVLPGQEAATLAPLPVRALYGVGPKAEQRLRALGLETIGALAACAPSLLVEQFGRSYGTYLARAARGEDDSILTGEERSARSISAEHTFGRDTADRALLWQTLREQAAEVAERLKAEGLEAEEVAIKLRYADWQTITRQTRLLAGTGEAEALARAAGALVGRWWDRERAIRLIGLRAGRLRPAGGVRQPTLFEA